MGCNFILIGAARTERAFTVGMATADALQTIFAQPQLKHLAREIASHIEMRGGWNQFPHLVHKVIEPCT